MNKSIITSLIVITLAAALVGGATMAWFTDSVEVPGNQFTAGTVIMELEPGIGQDTQIVLDNMAPGDSHSQYLRVDNVGTLDMLFRVTLADVVETGVHSLAEVLSIAYYLMPSDPGDGIWPGYDGRLPYGPGEDSPIWSGLLSDFPAAGLDNVAAAQGGFPLEPGYSALYRVEILLPVDTNDNYQGSSWTGTLVFDAVQSANQDFGNVQWGN